MKTDSLSFYLADYVFFTSVTETDAVEKHGLSFRYR